MGFYDDYVADGLCCEACGALLDMDEPGFARLCEGCEREERLSRQAAQALARKARKARKAAKQ